MPQSKVLITILIASLFTGCSWVGYENSGVNSPDNNPSVQRDLQEIRNEGKLVAITGFNSLSYFIYKGNPMGYDYELLKMFADDMGLELELSVVNNLDSAYQLLNLGKGDAIAFGLMMTKEGRRIASFTQPHMEVHQVLVQRKPEGWRKMTRRAVEDSLIRSPEKLASKSVHVRTGSAQMDRLFQLVEEIQSKIDIIPVKGDVTGDDLVRMVAEKEIDYTIVDENIALLGSTYFPDIDVRTSVSEPQGLVWAVRKNSPQLLQAFNDWLSKVKRTERYNLIYKKYFTGKKQIATWAMSDYFSEKGGKISDYDDIIRKNARLFGIDWRLLAAMICEESHFDPSCCSWAGAEGLMQLMTSTGLRFGGYDLADPEQNIRAGTAYFRWLMEFWQMIPDSSERIKFALASYNVGESHVEDAMMLAQKNGADPGTWDGSVAEYLKLKSKPKYYNDPVVESGYCRGEMTVRYVKDVLERYGHYSKIIAL